MKNRNALLRELPKVDEVLRLLAGETEAIPEVIVKRVIREVIGHWRDRVLAGQLDAVPTEAILTDIRMGVQEAAGFHLRGVINATGVILHTNLGRARLSSQAAEHIAKIATGYSNLEYTLENGARGSRYAHIEHLLTELTGTEAALVVNNNAAAVLLALDTLTKGKEVIVSRGELVEIGGAFRIPAIMERSGCSMIEVGTTNKTHETDYIDHITEETGALLKVHTSNYKIVGFTQEVTLPKLREIGDRHGIPVLYDLGSGLLMELDSLGIHGEPTVKQCAAYADAMCFSADKLLGGPQAGIIVGRKAMIERMKKNHLLRALRIDKLTLAALEYTLWQYLKPESVHKHIPTLQMLTESHTALEDKFTMLTSLLQASTKFIWEKAETQSQIGGGSLPDVQLMSLALAVHPTAMSVNELEKKLRQNAPPIITRVVKDTVLFDMRTIDYSELSAVATCLNNL